MLPVEMLENGVFSTAAFYSVVKLQNKFFIRRVGHEEYVKNYFDDFDYVRKFLKESELLTPKQMGSFLNFLYAWSVSDLKTSTLNVFKFEDRSIFDRIIFSPRLSDGCVFNRGILSNRAVNVRKVAFDLRQLRSAGDEIVNAQTVLSITRQSYGYDVEQYINDLQKLKKNGLFERQFISLLNRAPKELARRKYLVDALLKLKQVSFPVEKKNFKWFLRADHEKLIFIDNVLAKAGLSTSENFCKMAGREVDKIYTILKKAGDDEVLLKRILNDLLNTEHENALSDLVSQIPDNVLTEEIWGYFFDGSEVDFFLGSVVRNMNELSKILENYQRIPNIWSYAAEIVFLKNASNIVWIIKELLPHIPEDMLQRPEKIRQILSDIVNKISNPEHEDRKIDLHSRVAFIVYLLKFYKDRVTDFDFWKNIVKISACDKEDSQQKMVVRIINSLYHNAAAALSVDELNVIIGSLSLGGEHRLKRIATELEKKGQQSENEVILSKCEKGDSLGDEGESVLENSGSIVFKRPYFFKLGKEREEERLPLLQSESVGLTS
jgi:hypothetical protein